MRQPKYRSRKTLESKMAKVFNDEIRMLPADIQFILLDDLVTAFENRLEVFTPKQPALQCLVGLETKVQLNKIQI